MTMHDDDSEAPSGYFPKYDVENAYKYLKLFTEDEPVIVTEKIHGCLHYQSTVVMPDGSRKKISRLVKDQYRGKVLGFNFEENKVVETQVTNTFINGSTKNWINVKFDIRSCGSGNNHGSMFCTPNHKFFAVNRNKFITADCLTNKDIVRVIRYNLGITPIQEQVLIGKMLGDGSLHDKWIIKDKKQFPKSAISRVGPIALAFWYMDDGSLSHYENQEDRVCFACNNFSDNSIKNLQKVFSKFNINSIAYKAKGNRIRLNADDAEKFFLLIAPYVPKIMQYKLPKRYKGHNGWLPSQKSQYKRWYTDQKIKSIKYVQKSSKKYDLETETHNFFANGVLVHNSNARFTCNNGIMYAGSRTRWKKENETNLWWKGLRQNEWIEQWCRENEGFCLYGEVFGQVQDLKYGAQNNQIFFRAFDIWDIKLARWLDATQIVNFRREYWVPIVHHGRFNLEHIKGLAERDSVIPGAKHCAEGVVVRPMQERHDQRLGRVQVKFVSNRYFSKGK
jgi:hypothetical protein